MTIVGIFRAESAENAKMPCLRRSRLSPHTFDGLNEITVRADTSALSASLRDYYSHAKAQRREEDCGEAALLLPACGPWQPLNGKAASPQAPHLRAFAPLRD